MAKFLTVTEKGKESMINLDWVEHIIPEDDEGGRTVIFFAFNGHGGPSQDYMVVDQSYERIKNMVRGLTE